MYRSCQVVPATVLCGGDLDITEAIRTSRCETEGDASSHERHESVYLYTQLYVPL